MTVIKGEELRDVLEYSDWQPLAGKEPIRRLPQILYARHVRELAVFLEADNDDETMLPRDTANYVSRLLNQGRISQAFVVVRDKETTEAVRAINFREIEKRLESAATYGDEFLGDYVLLAENMLPYEDLDIEEE